MKFISAKNSIINIFRTHVDIIFLSIIVLLILFPTVNIRFSWIDDGWNINVAKNIITNFYTLNISGLFNNLFEITSGRMRPVYWIFQTIMFLLGDNYSSIYYFIHNIIILAASVVIYLLINFFTKSKFGSFFGSLLYILIPLNAENWVRLGPQEPFMVLLILLSIYYIFVKKNIKVSIFIIILGFLSKETAISIAPAFAMYTFFLYITKRKINLEIKYSIILLLTSVIIVVLSLLVKKGYSDYYVFDIQKILDNFWIYIDRVKQSFPFYILFTTTYLIRNIRPIVNFKFNKLIKVEIVQSFFLLSFLFFILIQSPWVWILDRYLLPAIAMGCIFVGIEINLIMFSIKKYTKLHSFVKVVFIIFLLIYSFYSYINLLQNVVRQKHATNSVYLLLNQISEISPKNSTVFFNSRFNESTYEPVIESKLHLELFFDREDIKLDYLENLNLNESPYIVVSSTIPPLGTYKFFEESKLSESKKLIKVESYVVENKYLIVSDFTTIIKQAIKKSVNYFRYGVLIDKEGMYTDYLLKDNWSLYYY